MQAADTTPKEDTPRAAFGVLPWRFNLAVVVGLLAVSVLAWQSTIEQSLSMSAMVMGLGQIGWLAQGDMSASVFLAMWVTMMVAMMLPTVAPIVLAHLAVTRQRGRGTYATLVFIAGYLLVWSGIGVVPFIAYKAIAQLSDDAAHSMWLPVLAGAILIVAGGYQFTRWKRVCFDHCQSPFAFIVTHDFGGGAASALRAGALHGLFCLGCCWALTAVLLAVGLMNLVWMVGIFAIFLVEKSWRHGLVVAKVTGVLLIVLGAAVIARPALLSTISL
jgi:predicted metal-binding membrane protein